MRKAISTLASTLILAQIALPAIAQQSTPIMPSPIEQVFVAFAQPCRIFDSHATSALPNNTDTNAFINLSGYNYPSQGGTNGGCGVPPSALAVNVSITTSGGSSNGFVTVTPGGNPASTYQASFLPNSPETAGMSIGLRANRITLHPIGGSVHASVDINGYFAPQIEAQINANGTIYTATSRIVSSSRAAMGQYIVTVDRNIITCSVLASVYTPTASTPAFATIYNSVSTINVFTYANNALADESFELAVHC